jgi:hypothetical protein
MLSRRAFLRSVAVAGTASLTAVALPAVLVAARRLRSFA